MCASPSLASLALTVLWADGRDSDNLKVGRVVTGYVGTTRAEARQSCAGCALLPAAPEIDDLGTPVGDCYAHTGTVRMAHGSVTRSYRRDPLRYELRSALARRRMSSRIARLTGIGDIGRCGADTAREIRDTLAAEGLRPVGYTHHWREDAVAEAWKGGLMASCDVIGEADDALAAGWRATAKVPADTPVSTRTPGGAPARVCPVQVLERMIEARAAARGETMSSRDIARAVSEKLDCDRCQLCAADRAGPVILFWEHGNAVISRDARARKSA